MNSSLIYKKKKQFTVSAAEFHDGIIEAKAGFNIGCRKIRKAQGVKRDLAGDG